MGGNSHLEIGNPLSDLYDAFATYFEIRSAKTTKEVNHCLRLRYLVYCLEKGFEPAELHPDGMEKDAYDFRSVHTLVIQRKTGRPVATVRLILADPADPERPFPIEVHCGPTFYKSFSLGCTTRPRVAEISRFAVLIDFRGRRGEAGFVHGMAALPPSEGLDDHERRVAPHLTLGLFRAALLMSVEQGVTAFYATMEPSLFRLLQRLGVRFHQIGEDSEYHGLRRPCFVEIDELLHVMHDERPDVWAFMTGDGRIWPLRAASAEAC